MPCKKKAPDALGNLKKQDSNRRHRTGAACRLLRPAGPLGRHHCTRVVCPLDWMINIKSDHMCSKSTGIVTILTIVWETRSRWHVLKSLTSSHSLLRNNGMFTILAIFVTKTDDMCSKEMTRAQIFDPELSC